MRKCRARAGAPDVRARGGENRARRRDGTVDHAQSALLPRPSARSFVQGPISPSFKKFTHITHTPLPLYLAAARRAQVDGRSSSTRARSVHRDARRDIRRVRLPARVGGAVPPSHPTPTGGSGRRSVARQRSAWGAGYGARRKQERDPRSFRILDSHTNAHVRRERPGQAVFRRSLVGLTRGRVICTAKPPQVGFGRESFRGSRARARVRSARRSPLGAAWELGGDENHRVRARPRAVEVQGRV